jgi:hypothetical protein
MTSASSHKANANANASASADADAVLPQQQQRSSAHNNDDPYRACRRFASQCFIKYAAPFCDSAMITEGEFLHTVEEMTKMKMRFIQFFGDMPFFGKHRTVMENLGIPNIPGCFQDSPKAMDEPILKTRCVHL